MENLLVLVSAFACHPHACSGLGGGEDILGWNIIKQVSRFNHIFVLAHPQNKAGIEAELQMKPMFNVEFHYLNLPRCLEVLQGFQGGIQFYAYLWQIKAYFVARKLHEQFQFDVFHHVTYANDWMASFIGALLPIPYIRGPGGGAHRTPEGFHENYSLRGRLLEIIRAIGQWLLRRDPFFVLGQHHASAILVCNHEALEAIPKKWRRKAYLFPVNGVSSRDLSLFKLSKDNNTKFCVLSAGRLLQIKGFDLAIRAFKAFVERHVEAEFTIIGDGPERERLEALVQQLELEMGQVHFERWMAHEELLTRMSACDVFLFPSLRDGGGAVVVEAMAMGKPVICLDIAGPGMHVTNECGIKVPAHSPNQVVHDLAVALDRLYLDKELRHKMGRAAHERAEQVYNWDRLGERLMEIYKNALGIESSSIRRAVIH